MKTQAILILFILILIGFILFTKSKDSSKIIALKAKSKEYVNQVERLRYQIMATESELKVIALQNEDYAGIIDSLKNMKHEIKTPNYKSIPKPERMAAIREFINR